jgi:hypothetical protein
MTNMTGSKLSIFSHLGKNNRLLDYYKIISLFMLKVNNYRLIHGHFHIGLVIIPRPILARDAVEGQYWNMEMPMY